MHLAENHHLTWSLVEPKLAEGIFFLIELLIVTQLMSTFYAKGCLQLAELI